VIEWKDMTVTAIGTATTGVNELARALAVHGPSSRIDRLKAAREYFARATQMVTDAIGEVQSDV